MAKKGRIERNERVLSVIKKDAEKRNALRAVLKKESSTQDEKFAVMIALQKISRDGSQTR